MSMVLRHLWLMEHLKPISAQCDTFLRIWVCQGHINIINEQEADWSETEWQKEGEEANRKAIFIFVSNMMYIYLWLWWWLLLSRCFEWWRDSVHLLWLPTISLAHRDKWIAVPFFLNPFGKSHFPLLFHAQWQRSQKYTKGNFSANLCEDSYLDM